MFMVHLQIPPEGEYESNTKVFQSLVLSNNPLYWVIIPGTE